MSRLGKSVCPIPPWLDPGIHVIGTANEGFFIAGPPEPRPVKKNSL